MADFLTEDAQFICNQGGKITCKDFGNSKVTHNGQTLLTTAAVLNNCFGICAIRTAAAQGVAKPCQCQLTAWIPGFSPMKISTGKSLLMDSAKNLCAFGGSISVVNSGVFSHLTTGSTPQKISLVAAKILEQKISAVEDKKISDQKNSVVEDKKISAGEDKIKFRCGTEKCQNKNCSYKKNSFRESSPVEKNEVTLRKNYYEYVSGLVGEKISDRIERRDKDLEFCKTLYKKISDSNYTDADKFFIQSLVKLHEILEDTNKLSWWYAAHHIIPGNEVFKNYPKCFRVANFVDENNLRVFDINCAENCIMLLTHNQSAKYDTTFDTLKKKIHASKILPQFIKNFTDVDNYELMETAESQLENKIQWHDTRHSYKFSKNEIESFSKKFVGKDLISYEKAVSNRVAIIESKINFNNLCPLEVRKDILNLIKNIRQHLSDFAKNPYASYPYYVTKKNYLYALLN